MNHPVLVAMDLEGVLIPEVWIAVAERTGIEKLKLTTRDIADYDVLMRGRLEVLREHGLTLADIQSVIAGMEPLEGARAFLDRLRAEVQVVILSDTFYEFAGPFMEKLGYPALFCNSLIVDGDGTVVDYHLRMADGKRHAVLAFRQLNFDVVATGDSYNDTAMLAEANCGILFRPSENVRAEFPEYAVAYDYDTLSTHIDTHRRG
jgi:phosphoserine/homoserine phosphotransferase